MIANKRNGSTIDEREAIRLQKRQRSSTYNMSMKLKNANMQQRPRKVVPPPSPSSTDKSSITDGNSSSTSASSTGSESGDLSSDANASPSASNGALVEAHKARTCQTRDLPPDGNREQRHRSNKRKAPSPPSEDDINGERESPIILAKPVGDEDDVQDSYEHTSGTDEDPGTGGDARDERSSSEWSEQGFETLMRNLDSCQTHIDSLRDSAKERFKRKRARQLPPPATRGRN